MNVTGGQLKGAKLLPPKNRSTRPITQQDKIRLFQVFGESLSGANFVDLFCGTGSVGIEALSLGASSCTFVDSSYSSFKVLKKNICNLSLEDRSVLYQKNVYGCYKRIATGSDFIFAGPPYKAHYYLKSLAMFEDIEASIESGPLYILQTSKQCRSGSITKNIENINWIQCRDILFEFYKGRG
ncbi:MAG: RsmD family RNA methyltransferase [Paraglaciecola sp.]|uniref:RsmD family RNA methyltransferase n=1 Tax=Paraglaciecola sp. TaxID=1920173 RepID=UPI003297B042